MIMSDDAQNTGTPGFNGPGPDNRDSENDRLSGAGQSGYRRQADPTPDNPMPGTPYEPPAAVPEQPAQTYGRPDCGQSVYGRPDYGATPTPGRQQTQYYNSPQAQPSGSMPGQPTPGMPPAQPIPGAPMPQGQPFAPQYQPQGYQQPFYGQGSTDESYSGLSIAAIITAVLLWPVGLILSIVSLFTLRKDGRGKGRGLSIAALIVSIVIGIVSILLVVEGVHFVDRLVSDAQSQAQSQYSAPTDEGDGSADTQSGTSKHYKSIQDWLDHSPRGRQATKELRKQKEQGNEDGYAVELKDGGDQKLVMDITYEDSSSDESDSSGVDMTDAIMDAFEPTMKALALSLQQEGFDHPTVELLLHSPDNSFQRSATYDTDGKIS